MPQFAKGQLLRLRSDLEPDMFLALARYVRPQVIYLAKRVHGGDAVPLVQLVEYNTKRPVLGPHDLCPADLSADFFEPVPRAV